MSALQDFDPVTLEILWSRLISITDESAAALLRTSFSTIVRESNDYATVLMDASGDALAENTAGIPSFVGILPRTLRDHLLTRFPSETWRPGDCVITNDPWLATGHLPDITMAAPIYHRGRLVGFSGSIAHSPDIGGSLAVGGGLPRAVRGRAAHPAGEVPRRGPAQSRRLRLHLGQRAGARAGPGGSERPGLRPASLRASPRRVPGRHGARRPGRALIGSAGAGRRRHAAGHHRGAGWRIPPRRDRRRLRRGGDAHRVS